MKKIITFAIAILVTTPVFAKKHTVEEFTRINQKIYVTDTRDNLYRFQHDCNILITPYATIEAPGKRLRENARIIVKDNNRVETCRVKNLELVKS